MPPRCGVPYDDPSLQNAKLHVTEHSKPVKECQK